MMTGEKLVCVLDEAVASATRDGVLSPEEIARELREAARAAYGRFRKAGRRTWYATDAAHKAKKP